MRKKIKTLLSPPLLAHTGGCAGLVGVDVVWLHTHEMKIKEIN
jgi:hypothetical protein